MKEKRKRKKAKTKKMPKYFFFKLNARKKSAFDVFDAFRLK
jgi:hypothetical protein